MPGMDDRKNLPTGPVQARLDLGRLGLVVSTGPARRCTRPAGSHVDERRGPARSTSGVCVACHERPARYRYRGIVQADETHVLCYRCYRQAVTRHRAALDAVRRSAASSRVSSKRRVAGRGPLGGLVEAQHEDRVWVD